MLLVENAISATSRAANGPSGPAMRAIAPRAAGNTMARPVRIAELCGVANPADSLARAVARVGMDRAVAGMAAAVRVAGRTARAERCVSLAGRWEGEA